MRIIKLKKKFIIFVPLRLPSINLAVIDEKEQKSAVILSSDCIVSYPQATRKDGLYTGSGRREG